MGGGPGDGEVVGQLPARTSGRGEVEDRVEVLIGNNLAGGWCSCGCRFEGDLVAEGFELADVVLLAAFGA